MRQAAITAPMAKPKTYGLTHIAVGVKDLKKTKDFYQSVFDMKVMYDEPDFIQLTTPGAHDIIVEKNNSATGTSGGIAHFGFRLRNAGDIEAMKKKIRQAGGVITDQESSLRARRISFSMIRMATKSRCGMSCWRSGIPSFSTQRGYRICQGRFHGTIPDGGQRNG